MSIDRKIAAVGLMALQLACGSASFAQTQGKESQARERPAAPSSEPASQATPQAITGPSEAASSTKVGNQPAAPSELPAPKATPEAVKKETSAPPK